MHSHTSLKMRSKIEFVFAGLFFDGDGPNQLWQLFLNQCQGRFKVLVDVGPEMQFAARYEDTNYLSEKTLVHDPSLAVPFFPPWIRKVNVDGVN